MIETWLMLGLVYIGGALMVATPWVIVVEGIYEARRGRVFNSIAWLVGVLLCIFEVAAIIDWAFGLGSPPL